MRVRRVRVRVRGVHALLSLFGLVRLPGGLVAGLVVGAGLGPGAVHAVKSVEVEGGYLCVAAELKNAPFYAAHVSLRIHTEQRSYSMVVVQKGAAVSYTH